MESAICKRFYRGLVPLCRRSSAGRRPPWEVYPGARTAWPWPPPARTPSTPACWPSSEPGGKADRPGGQKRWPPARPGKQPAHGDVLLCMSRSETKFGCVSCGDELHPERAEKYDYCMKPECQAKNLKGLTMVAVGVNKSAEQYLLLDEDTKAELAQGKYHDQRRGTFGPPGPAPGQPRAARPAAPPQASTTRPARPRPARLRPVLPSPVQPRPAPPGPRPARRVPPRPDLAGPGCLARHRSAGWRSCTTSRACGRTRSPASLG